MRAAEEVTSSAENETEAWMKERARTSIVAAGMAAVGGIAIVVGSALAWIDAGNGVTIGTQSVSGAPRGLDLPIAPIVGGAGVAAVVIGVLIAFVPAMRRTWGALLLATGASVIASAVWVSTELQDRYVTFAAGTAPAGPSPVADIEASVHHLIATSALPVVAGAGFYVATAGGVLTVVAGVLTMLHRRGGVSVVRDTGPALSDTPA
jgi:hypothetical protein